MEIEFDSISFDPETSEKVGKAMERAQLTDNASRINVRNTHLFNSQCSWRTSSH